MGMGQQNSIYIFKFAIVLGSAKLLPQVFLSPGQCGKCLQGGEAAPLLTDRGVLLRSRLQIFLVEGSILAIGIAKVQEKLPLIIFKEDFIASDFPDASVERKLYHAATEKGVNSIFFTLVFIQERQDLSLIPQFFRFEIF